MSPKRKRTKENTETRCGLQAGPEYNKGECGNASKSNSGMLKLGVLGSKWKMLQKVVENERVANHPGGMAVDKQQKKAAAVDAGTSTTYTHKKKNTKVHNRCGGEGTGGARGIRRGSIAEQHHYGTRTSPPK